MKLINVEFWVRDKFQLNYKNIFIPFKKLNKIK